ncbi:MAG: LPS export ABC transporter permease LptF [Deltaproteobacteria bacterium]|nr:LPS export ABC transporter permease LptF [Deltaproteobacteria bacterium]
MIIDRYLIREISKPLIAICAFLVVIFASYRAAQYLAEAVAGLISGKTVLYLVLLKIAIAMEVLLPTTLYLSVVIVIGRLYEDSEMTALFACGVGIGRVFRAVIYLSVPLAILVACLSLYVRPWAYQQSYVLTAMAKTALDIGKWKEGNFYKIPGMNRVIYADRIEQEKKRAEGVFIQSDQGDRVQVIYAKEVQQYSDDSNGKPLLIFRDGYLYEFSRTGEQGHFMKFKQSTMSIYFGKTKPLEYKRKAAPTLQLARSNDLEDIAEYQWRLSTPISTLLLALLAIPLSRTAPRRGKYAKLVTAVLVLAVYYNTSAMAKDWVEQGVVGPVVGIWWVVVLLAIVGLILSIQPRLVFQWRRIKQRLLSKKL